MSSFLPPPSGVALLRQRIVELRDLLFLVGYQDMDRGGAVPLLPPGSAFTSLWDLWRSNLPRYAPPPEYVPPPQGSETPNTRRDMFRALDGLTRRLEELFGPDPEGHAPGGPEDGAEIASAGPLSRGEGSHAGDGPHTALTTTPPPPTSPGPEVAPPGPPTDGATSIRYTLGALIDRLDAIDAGREFRRLKYQADLQRNPLNAAMNRAYESALAWRPDETQMPGISRIELLCDRLGGEAGVTAAKVRRLRADVCDRLRCGVPAANALSLVEAANALEGVHRVSPADLRAAQRDQLHHGLATLDTIQIGVEPGDVVEVTGLSCKVVAGTVPTACPDAEPALPPSLLAKAEEAVRRLYPLPPGTTVHWVGHDTGYRSRCRCYPNAPFAAPFDRERWPAVAPGPAAAVREEPEPSPDRTTKADPVSPITVGDLRDFFRYEERLVAYRERLRTVTPGEVFAARHFPSAQTVQSVLLLASLVEPEPPRLTEGAAWALMTYRRLVESARAGGRLKPDESDLMLLVGSVANTTGTAVEEILKMAEADFSRLESVNPPPPGAPATFPATSLPPAGAGREAAPAGRGESKEESVPPGPRLVFDDSARTIALDGRTDDVQLAPDVYQFLKAIGAGDRCGRMVSGNDITRAPGLASKKLKRVVEKLPFRWQRLVTSQRGSGGGYCLTLPPRSCP